MVKVKELGQTMKSIGFAHKPSYGVQKNANLSRLLITEEEDVLI